MRSGVKEKSTVKQTNEVLVLREALGEVGYRIGEEEHRANHKKEDQIVHEISRSTCNVSR